MKASKLLQIILAASLFAGCSVASSSSNPKVGANETAQSAFDENQNQSKKTIKQTKPKPMAAPVTGAICPDPAQPCHHREKHFDEWEMPFRLPARLKDNVTNKSVLFYAVIVKSYMMTDDCDGGEYVEEDEKERKELQNAYPERKVFASYQCPNMGAVNYDFPGRWNKTKDELAVGNFIAIYAGATEAEAEELLEQLKADYPKAEIKRMTAMYEKIVQ